MADNYLEKKMDALRNGPVVVRRTGASTETLLRQLAKEQSLVDNYDGKPSGSTASNQSHEASSSVMPAQCEAVIRAGKLALEGTQTGISPDALRFECDSSGEDTPASIASATIRILGPNSPGSYLTALGEVLLAMRLKAAELHLHSIYALNTEAFPPGNRLLATLQLRHP